MTVKQVRTWWHQREITKGVQWLKKKSVEAVLYVLEMLWGRSVRTWKFPGQYYMKQEVTGQYHPWPLWPYNLMFILGALLPMFVITILPYDHIRGSNTCSRMTMGSYHPNRSVLIPIYDLHILLAIWSLSLQVDRIITTVRVKFH